MWGLKGNIVLFMYPTLFISYCFDPSILSTCCCHKNSPCQQSTKFFFSVLILVFMHWWLIFEGKSF